MIVNAGIREVFYGEFYRDERSFDVAKQLGIRLELVEQMADAAVDAERDRLAREIHDDIDRLAVEGHQAIQYPAGSTLIEDLALASGQVLAAGVEPEVRMQRGLRVGAILARGVDHQVAAGGDDPQAARDRASSTSSA